MIELTQVIGVFRKQFPDTTFDFYTGIADDIKDRLDNGLIDVGLLIEPVEISRYHYVRLPRAEKWCLLVRKDSPLAELESISPKDLLGVSLSSGRCVYRVCGEKP